MAIVSEFRELYRTHDDIVSGIIEQIKLREPLWATEPGTPLRKVIDSVASMLQQLTLDAFFAQISWDIESKSGTELDEFVAIFGFERKKATKSTGFVKYFAAEDGGASERYIIPGNSRVTTAPIAGQSLAFLTTDTVVLEIGATQAEAPIIAEAAGSVYNVEANTIVIEAAGVVGIGGDTPVRNENATTGGSDAESDEALRERFRRTIFRNIAGTKEAYIGAADTNEFVTSNRVSVYSQSERREDIVQFSDVDQLGAPWVTGEKRAYIFRTGVYFESELIAPLDGASIPENRDYYTRYTDYVMLTDLSGTYLETVPGSAIANGQLVLASYEYKSEVSRADAEGNSRNVVDVFVGGADRQTATDLQVQDDAKIYNASSRLAVATTGVETEIELYDIPDNFPVNGTVEISSPPATHTYTGRTENRLTGLSPVAGVHPVNTDVVDVTDRIFNKLMFQPVDELSDTIVVGNKIYREGIDYQLVKTERVVPDLPTVPYPYCTYPVNGNAGSWRATDGIAWEVTAVAPAQNEIQRIQEDTPSPSGGSLTLTFDGFTTGPISVWDASTIESALEGLTNIGVGNVTVTGGALPGTAIDIEFTGGLAETSLPTITIDQTLVVGGTFEIVEVQDGAGPVPDRPADTTEFRVDYVWDQLPKTLYDQIYTGPVRNITADVLVHSGVEVYFGINFAIMYDSNVNVAQVNAEIERLLTAEVEGKGFGQAIQLSDFIDIAYNAAGVDNVRYVREDEDAVNFGIRIFDDEGNTSLYRGQKNYINDFVLADDEIPVLQETNLTIRAQNTW